MFRGLFSNNKNSKAVINHYTKKDLSKITDSEIYIDNIIYCLEKKNGDFKHYIGMLSVFFDTEHIFFTGESTNINDSSYEEISFQYSEKLLHISIMGQTLFIEDYMFKLANGNNNILETLKVRIDERNDKIKEKEKREQNEFLGVNSIDSIHVEALDIFVEDNWLSGNMVINMEKLNFVGTDFEGNEYRLELNLSANGEVQPIKILDNDPPLLELLDIYIKIDENNSKIERIINHFESYNQQQMQLDSDLVTEIKSYYDKLNLIENFDDMITGFFNKSNLDVFLNIHIMIAFEILVKVNSKIYNRKIFNIDFSEKANRNSFSKFINDDHRQIAYDFYINNFLPLKKILLSKVLDEDLDNFVLGDAIILFTLYDKIKVYAEGYFKHNILNVDITPETTLEEIFIRFENQINNDDVNFCIFNYVLLNRNLSYNSNYIDSSLIHADIHQAIKDKAKLINFEKSLYNSNESSIITIDDIDLMSGHEFERFIAKLFKNMGYSTNITKGSGDQGIDVIADKNGKKIGIQTKCYTGNVTNSAIQEVVAGLTHYKLDKAMVITNSSFTQSARELAQSNGVVLWDREILKEKVEAYSVELF